MPEADHSYDRAPPPSWRVELAAVAGLLVVFVALLAPTLDQPLLEKHDFRQTQTAYTARIFHEEGIDLLHPRLPVLGEPFEVPFEFPLYQATASLVMDLGVADDIALRVTTVFFFLVTGLLLYGLVRYVAGSIAAIGALVAFVVTPFAVVWSRASMMEYMATAGAVGFAWAFIAWRDKRQPVVGALCLVAGLVGMLVKPTTAIFWLIPALAFRATGPNRVELRRDPWTAAFVVAPLVAAIAWTAHADAIKQATRATQWLTSSALRNWNFGTLDQRLDPSVWREIGARYAFLLLGPVGSLLLVAAVFALWRTEQRRFWIGMACAAFLPPLVFTNLYKVHDYYLTAVAPSVAALIGLGAALVVSRIRRLRMRVMAVIAGLVLLSVWFGAGYRYWDVVVEGHQQEGIILGLAKELDRVTEPSDLVAVQGLDWNPALFYYARRQGHMAVGQNEPFAWNLIHDGPYEHLVVFEPDATDLRFTARWGWIGVLGEHTYAIGDSPDELSGSSFIATERGPQVDAHLSGARRLRSPGTIDCGVPVRIPAGSEGTWIELSEPPSTARIAVTGLAPLPARQLVYVGPELGDAGHVAITCSPLERLSIANVWDAGPVG